MTQKDRIKHAREGKGWTQQNLADAVGCGQSIIGNLESGSQAGSKWIPKVAHALDVCIIWLTDGTGPMRPSGMASPALTPRQQALLGLFDGLTAGQQEEEIRRLEAQKQSNDAIVSELMKKRRA